MCVERQFPALHEPAYQWCDGVLTIRLPWCPSVNDYKVPHPRLRGVYFLTKRAKKFREDVQSLCTGAHRFGAADIEVNVTLHPPDRRARDADNFGTKAAFDALQASRVFDDDCQVQSYRVTKGAVVRGGAVVIEIWERSC
jgi:crossover junction endodeoxyribonuclease RusA